MIEFLQTPHRLAIARPRGVLNLHLLRQLVAALRQLEQTEPVPFDRLADLSRISDVRLSSDELLEVARTRRDDTADLAPCRAAILAPAPPCYAVASMYQLIMDRSPVHIHVCGSPEPAAEWLNLPPRVVQYSSEDETC